MTDVNLGLDLGVVTERQVLGSGRKVRVYRCPFPSEGPLRLRSGDQQHCLVYMYAHFVFTVRHEALDCRVGVKDHHSRAVAAVPGKLRAA